MRIAVKKILRKHGYPPNLELKATDTVLAQAKLLAAHMAEPKIYDLNSRTSMAADPE